MKIHRSQKGQATVELALTISIFFLLLFGIIDFGRIFHTYITLTHSSREAARVASIGGTDEEIVAAAVKASPSLQSSKLSASVSPSKGARTKGTYATVQLNYSFTVSTPFMSSIIPNPFIISAKLVTRME